MNKNISNNSLTLELAAQYLNQGKLLKAESICREILNQNNNDADCLNFLSFILSRKSAFIDAIQCLEKAINIQPNNYLFHNNISNLYSRISNYNKAKLHLYQALKISPNYAEGYNNLGNIYYKQNILDKAISYFEKSIRLDPNSINAHINLANALSVDNKYDRAISHYEKALEIAPNNVTVLQNLSMVYVEKNITNKAIKTLEKLLTIYKEHNKENEIPNEIYIHLAESYLNEGVNDKAKPIYTKAIKLNPNTEFLHHNYAVLLLRENDYTNALYNFKEALRLNPNNKTAKHMINAIEGKNLSSSASKEYVNDLFDQYASYYNKHVTEKLDYKVPSILRSMVAEYIKLTDKKLHVLDIGCGTGLCGPYFRDMAFNFIGVDLSYNMLLVAKTLKAYDLLLKQDINQCIPGENQEYFDYIIAADVFVYLGDLENIFKKCCSALKSGGKLVFSIENLNSENTYSLAKSGRYCHSLKYINNLCSTLNFKKLSCKEVTLRFNDNSPIQGTCIVIEKQY